MTDRELMQQALEALEDLVTHFSFKRLNKSTLADTVVRGDAHAAITALRTAIERAEKQEPVAWGMESAGGGFIVDCITPEEHARKEGGYTVPLYTTQAAAPVQEPEYCDPSTTVYKLAEMVMSDCGHSSNNQRLLDRIADRIQRHMDDVTPPAAQQEPCAMRHSFDGYGYKYIDSGSGSNWLEFARRNFPDAEPVYEQPAAQRQPLTDEQIEAIWKEHHTTLGGWDFGGCRMMDEYQFEKAARIIEAAHDITGEKK